jgi:hypothetical protein
VNTPMNYQQKLNLISSYKCKQSTAPQCTREALANTIKSQGIKAAYCNDQFLVIHTDLSAGYPMWLEDIPSPPGGGEDHDRTDQSLTGIFCQTGYESMYEEYGVYKFPLYPTPLETSDYTNNLNTRSYPAGATRNSVGGHFSVAEGAGGDYGLPTRGPIGLTVTGQELFPIYNNVGYYTPQKCEVDSCNQHVGAGGGQTHIHGDPFGAWCMYDLKNYTMADRHPPQIGWIFDGYATYGRHIDEKNLGYDVPLDGCGGHQHDDYDYHYHAQIIAAETDGGVYNPPTPTYDDVNPAGIPYVLTTPGPWVCMKGDISLVPNYWSSWKQFETVESYITLKPDTTMSLCYDSTEYYTAPGYKLPIVKSFQLDGKKSEMMQEPAAEAQPEAEAEAPAEETEEAVEEEDSSSKKSSKSSKKSDKKKLRA